MHIKAIPAAVSNALGGHTVLLVGVAALAAGGYWYYTNKVASAAPAATTSTTDPATLGNQFTQAPVSLGGIGASSASGADTLSTISGTGSDVSSSTTDATTGVSNGGGVVTVAPTAVVPTSSGGGGFFSVTDPSTGNTGPFPQVAGIDPATAELLAQQRLTLDYNYQEYMANLDLQANISAANAFLTNEAIQSNNYTAAIGLVQSFFFSPDQASLGQITGPDGQTLVNFALIQAQNSNKNGFDSNLTTLVNNGTFSNFIAQTQPQAVTPVSSVAPSSLPQFVLPSSVASGTPTYINPANVNLPVTSLPPSQTVTGNTAPPVQVATIAPPTITPANTNTLSSGFVAAAGGGGGGGREFGSNLQDF